MAKIVKKEKTKGRSEEGRGSKDKIKKNVKREIVKDIKNVGKGMALAASLLPTGRAVKAVKAAKAAKAAKNAPKPKVNYPPPPPSGLKPTYKPETPRSKTWSDLKKEAAAERKAAQDRKQYLANERKKTPKPPKPSKPGLRMNYGGWMS